MLPRILLIQHGAASAKVVLEALDRSQGNRFCVDWVEGCADGVSWLRRQEPQKIDLVLLDLGLPEGGFQAFEKLVRVAPQTPFVLLADSVHEPAAQHALRHGARDYLLKQRVDDYWLPKMLSEVIAHSATADALFFARARMQTALNTVCDAVVGADVEGKVTFLNERAERLSGWSGEEAVGEPLSRVFRRVDSATGEAELEIAALAIRQNRSVVGRGDCVLLHRDGEQTPVHARAAPIRDRANRVCGAVVLFQDASDAQATSLKMSHLAQHDYLTDLPNRMLLGDRLAHTIALAHRHKQRLAVVFVDVDRFKRINDSLGHAVGDRLLQSVARRLQGCVRQSDTVSRFGGDEFVIVLSDIVQLEDVELTADKILVAMNAPHRIDDRELHVTASIGIAVYPDDGQDAETILRHADIAMFRAKEAGRNSHQSFRPQMDVRAVERQSLEDDLRRAVQRDEFLLHYQPRVCLDTGVTSGVEALIRWRHPKRGLLLPAEFIPLAEECGMIVPIDRWVLREACRQARAWLDAGLPAIDVAVNMSAVDLRRKGFVSSVEETLQEMRLDPHRFEFELTETSLVREFSSTDAVLRDLKSVGVKLALDDFGTGYAGLTHLKRFPVDVLKIDRSFVRDMTVNEDDAAIVRGVIAIARSMGRLVVAEGVETGSQRSFLRRLRCNQAQGYLFGRPVPGEQIVAKLLRPQACAARP